MWEPAAQGNVMHWGQIRASFPKQPLVLYGPGRDSGTFDYFTLAIVGAEGESRSDYTSKLLLQQRANRFGPWWDGSVLGVSRAALHERQQ
jgi:hypothetical protein